MSPVDMSPDAVFARLRQATAGLDLRPERRLDTKVDYSDAGITARLREVDRLNRLCRALQAFGDDPDGSS